MIFNTSKAIVSAVTTVTAASVGLLIAFGIGVSKQKLGAIVEFESVTVPVALAVFAVLHHNSVKASIGGVNAHHGADKAAPHRTHAR